MARLQSPVQDGSAHIRGIFVFAVGGSYDGSAGGSLAVPLRLLLSRLKEDLDFAFKL